MFIINTGPYYGFTIGITIGIILGSFHSLFPIYFGNIIGKKKIEKKNKNENDEKNKNVQNNHPKNDQNNRTIICDNCNNSIFVIDELNNDWLYVNNNTQQTCSDENNQTNSSQNSSQKLSSDRDSSIDILSIPESNQHPYSFTNMDDNEDGIEIYSKQHEEINFQQNKNKIETQNKNTETINEKINNKNSPIITTTIRSITGTSTPHGDNIPISHPNTPCDLVGQFIDGEKNNSTKSFNFFQNNNQNNFQNNHPNNQKIFFLNNSNNSNNSNTTNSNSNSQNGGCDINKNMFSGVFSPIWASDNGFGNGIDKSEEDVEYSERILKSKKNIEFSVKKSQQKLKKLFGNWENNDRNDGESLEYNLDEGL
jgi:hypothetical protein